MSKYEQIGVGFASNSWCIVFVNPAWKSFTSRLSYSLCLGQEHKNTLCVQSWNLQLMSGTNYPKLGATRKWKQTPGSFWMWTDFGDFRYLVWMSPILRDNGFCTNAKLPALFISLLHWSVLHKKTGTENWSRLESTIATCSGKGTNMHTMWQIHKWDHGHWTCSVTPDLAQNRMPIR